jgi:hypothetical protein
MEFRFETASEESPFQSDDDVWDDDDIWDLDQLQIFKGTINDLTPRKRLPRHRKGEGFIKGPIPHVWLVTACQLPGSGFHVAMVYRFLCGRFRGRARWGLKKIAKGLNITARTVQRGLHAAELAGLLTVKQKPGCKLIVSIRELSLPESKRTRRPLRGSLPWDWWEVALQLPGRSLQVAVVCWLTGERLFNSAVFELPCNRWADFGLSRDATSRGLDQLEHAGLVSVVRRPGQCPVVTVLDCPSRSSILSRLEEPSRD